MSGCCGEPLRRIRLLGPDQLFTNIEQLLFTKVLAIAEKEGKPVRLAVAAANDLWEGILRAAANLQSTFDCFGQFFSKSSITEQAREIGLAWERIQEPKPRVSSKSFRLPAGNTAFYSALTPLAIDTQRNRPAAQSRLEFSDYLPGKEIHHHDIVPFCPRRSRARNLNGKRARFLTGCRSTCTKSRSPPEFLTLRPRRLKVLRPLNKDSAIGRKC